MTVILYDYRNGLPEDCKDIRELLYADDTLLIGTCSVDVQLYMDTIATEGRKYGLLLNCDKSELLRGKYSVRQL